MTETKITRHHGTHNPPVIIIGFARKQNIVEIGERILHSQPCCLFVQIDGGTFRANSKDIEDLALVLTRMATNSTKVRIVVEDSNLGIAHNLTKGVEAVFVDHSSVIVLEDDCYPAPVFYDFMSAALRQHCNNPEIGMISGNAYVNYSDGPLFAEVSNVPQTWGWATWRDRWEGFDVGLSRFTQDDRRQAIYRYSRNPMVRSHWDRRLSQSIDDRNMWDAQWSVFMWIRNLGCINPSENLVKNYGTGDDAVHTAGGSIFTDWEASTRTELTDQEILAIGKPKKWKLTRRLQHSFLLRLSLITLLLEKLWPRSRALAVRAARIVASRRYPQS